MQQHERTEQRASITHPDAVGTGNLTAPAADAGADFPNVVTLGDKVADDCGPFIVYSREFAPARVPVFETYREALQHARWLANSTPGFAYYIMSPVGGAMAPALGVEAAAVRHLEQAAVAQ